MWLVNRRGTGHGSGESSVCGHQKVCDMSRSWWVSSSDQERGEGRGDPGAVTWDDRRDKSLSKGGCFGG